MKFGMLVPCIKTVCSVQKSLPCMKGQSRNKHFFLCGGERLAKRGINVRQTFLGAKFSSCLLPVLYYVACVFVLFIRIVYSCIVH